MNEFKKNKIYSSIAKLSFAALVVSLAVQVYVSNTTALKGKDFVELYDRKKELERELALLEFEKSTYSSLTYIETEAQKLGYVGMTESLIPIRSPALALLNVGQ